MYFANRQRHLRQRGFSLIELMIVIAIIGILVGVGIPAWRYMMRNSNEAATILTINRVREAQQAYANSHRGDFGTFPELLQVGALDDKYAGDAPVINGYSLNMKVTKKSGSQTPFFSINANPQEPGQTGNRYFYIDSKVNSVHANDTQEASATDPSV